MGQGPDSRRPSGGRRLSGADLDNEEPTMIGKAPPLPDRSESKRDRPYFIVLAGSNLGKTFKIEGDTVVGRSGEAQIRLQDEGISRKHARIFLEKEELWIEDLRSANGTIINGVPIDRQRLRDGDKIRVGATTILKFTYNDDLENNFQQKMYDAALYDGLTRAFNKRYFLDRMAEEIAYAKRHNSPLSLMMLDVDHFKAVNDRFGHPAGDQVLVQLAQTIAGQLRREDIFARYGGEEFAVLCIGVSLEATCVLAERMRGVVEATVFDLGDTRVPVTISLGVAAHAPGAVDGATRLIAGADEALYEAKRGGRNRVVASGRKT
jgi:two-component system, cell cycle response regulator